MASNTTTGECAWQHDVLDVIDARSSTRKFAEVEVTDEQRQAVLHAASRAPSGAR